MQSLKHFLSILPSITIWFPFIIFFVGYFLTWRKSQIDKKKEVKIYRNLFVEWIRLAKNRTLEQSKNCKDFANRLLTNEFIDAEYFAFVPLMYGKLNSINPDKILNSFVFNINGQQEDHLVNFNKMIANINFLDRIELDLKEKYERSSNDLRKINELFNASFINLERIYLKKRTEIGDGEDKDKKHVKIFGDIFENWSRTADKSLDGITANHTFDRLVTPWLSYVNDVFPRYKSSQFLLEIADELANMNLVKRQWDIHKKGHSQIILSYGSSISSSYMELENCITYYQATKVVCFWKIK